LEPDKRAALIQEGKDLKEKLSAIEGTLQALEYEMQTEGQKVPNDTHPAVPIGGEELAVLRKEVGAQRNFSFEAASHVDIGERLGMFDFETGGKVCGSRFVYLTGAGAMLELALINWAMAKVVSKGFKPMVVPDLVRQQVRVGAFPNLTHTVPVSPHKTETFLFQKQTMEKCGFQPRAENTQVYNIEGTDLCLAGTAEILLGGVYMDEVVAEKDLPIKMAAFSHCFRTEAGAAGSATRGLYRLHQFSKVEMFVIATPEQSDALHDELTEIEQEMYTELGFHFKVLDMSSQDLGAPAYRKFDIEAWMPALGRYGEISSASNCTDYQARRLNIKFRPEAVDGKKQPLKHVHTLNATACAVPRMIITILENFQNEDGSVDVPAPLQPFMGGVTKLTPEVVDAKKEGK
jgi:seryl-tRNA synthetase